MKVLKSVFGRSLSEPQEYKPFANAIKRGCEDSGVELTNIHHGVITGGKGYCGIGLVKGYDGITLGWRNGNDYRTAPQLWIGLIPESGDIGMLAQLCSWGNRVNDANSHRQIVSDRLSRLPKVYGAVNERLEQMRSMALDWDVVNTALINTIRDGGLTPSRLMDALIYLDDCEELTVWELYSAMLTTLRPVSNTDIIKPLFERSPIMYRSCRDLAT